MRRVLVTGGAGFIGSHVVDALRARGDRPEVLDDLSKGQVTNLPDDVPLHIGDIADASRVRALFEARRFDAVVHCAAQTNVMRSIVEPALDRRINIDGLQAVLDASTATGVRRFVFISSGGAIYGETPAPANEETPPAPTNPYGRHKLEGEARVARAAVSTCSLRLSNVYGPRQRSDAEGGVISIFVERIAHGMPLQVYGDGEQQRDFVHVGDVVEAVLMAIDREAMLGSWNVGTGVATSINEIVKLVQFVAPRAVEVTHLPERGEVRRSCLDVAKLRALGWRPQRELGDALASLVGAAATATT
jgi:UDP-glucose 4-epimerase